MHMKNSLSEGERNDCLLRCGLKANACFSLLSALILLFASVPISEKIGGIHAYDLRYLSFGLLLYCIFLWKTAHRDRITALNAWPFVILDLGWVLGSAAVIFCADLTVMGKWVVGLLADVVLVLAIAQLVGILRLKAHRDRAAATPI
jgi:hypothetical protein